MNWMPRILFFLFTTVFLVLLGCAQAQNPPPPPIDAGAGFGSLIDVGGHKLFITCSGKAVKGSPTVILEAGLNQSSETWSTIQPEVARFARVCAYDRAGMGKSQAAPGGARHSRQIATELRLLLSNAGIPGPYLMVGHSFGGVHARTFASRYPRDVVGMVLVDSVHEDETARWTAMIPPDIRKQMEAEGATRLMGGEAVDVETSFSQLRAARRRTSIPLFVIARGRASFTPDNYPPPLRAFAPKGEELRVEMQQDLARRSKNGRLIFAEKSGHMIHHDEPELVVDTIRQVMSEVPRKAAK